MLCVQVVVEKARAALLNSQLTGEASLPSSHQSSASRPAAHAGGFYMGEVCPVPNLFSHCSESIVCSLLYAQRWTERT